MATLDYPGDSDGKARALPCLILHSLI